MYNCICLYGERCFSTYLTVPHTLPPKMTLKSNQHLLDGSIKAEHYFFCHCLKSELPHGADAEGFTAVPFSYKGQLGYETVK